MHLRNIFAELWPWRWSRSAAALARGVRLHPTAVILGRPRQLRLGRGTVIGARTRIVLGDQGHVVAEGSVWISSDVEIQTNTEVRLGSGTSVQRRCTLIGTTRVGRGCIFAPNVFVSSATHPFRLQPHLPIREQERQLRKSSDSPGGPGPVDAAVWIQDDCWLGTNVVVCPGVTVGKGAVVGANSVVVDDVTPYSVVGGAPARRIGARLSWCPPTEVKLDRAQDLVYVVSGVPVPGPHGMIRAVAATAEESVRVMIAPGAQRIRVDYKASHDLTVCAANFEYEVRSGRGTLEIPASQLAMGSGAAALELILPGASSAVTLEVHRVAHARST